MKEGAKGTQDAFYFLSSGCEPLRKGLGIEGLLLPPVLASHMASSVAAGEAIDLGNEIIWDDFEASDKRLGAAAFMNHMSVLKVSVWPIHQLSTLGLAGRPAVLFSRHVCSQDLRLASHV